MNISMLLWLQAVDHRTQALGDVGVDNLAQVLREFRRVRLGADLHPHGDELGDDDRRGEGEEQGPGGEDQG